MRIASILVLVFGLACLTSFGGCKEEGSAEKAGKQLDDAMDDAGKAIDDAAADAKDAIDDK